ncbi:MAG: Leucine-rich repeat (LRR) protein [Vicingaceae bacterium]|jgi:Leucine-rich repeat (LRR) protein
MTFNIFQQIAQILDTTYSEKCKAKAASLQHKLSQTTSLNLRDLDLSTTDAISIAELIATKSDLLSISFSYNKIEDKGVIALITNLPKSVREIGLVDCSIGDRAGEVILEWLKCNPQLKMICMEKNNFSAKLLSQFKQIKRTQPNLLLVV